MLTKFFLSYQATLHPFLQGLTQVVGTSRCGAMVAFLRLEMASRKLTTGACFEVGFKRCSLFATAESMEGFNLPRPKFSRVEASTFIMFLKSNLQIVG